MTALAAARARRDYMASSPLHKSPEEGEECEEDEAEQMEGEVYEPDEATAEGSVDVVDEWQAPSSELNSEMKQVDEETIRRCGAPGTRGPCLKVWGTCPYHSSGPEFATDREQPGTSGTAQNVHVSKCQKIGESTASGWRGR
jgi:hypothetical protein